MLGYFNSEYNFVGTISESSKEQATLNSNLLRNHSLQPRGGRKEKHTLELDVNGNNSQLPGQGLWCKRGFQAQWNYSRDEFDPLCLYNALDFISRKIKSVLPCSLQKKKKRTAQLTERH